VIEPSASTSTAIDTTGSVSPALDRRVTGPSWNATATG
jgi:hypothetical protein